MKRYIRLYSAFLHQHFKVHLEYRMNFLISAVGVFLWQGASVLAIWVVVSPLGGLPGWKPDKILLIYGLLTLAMALPRIFAFNLFFLGQRYIRPGGFDRLLVRPINPLFHLLADMFSPEGVGDFLVGLALVVRAMGALSIPWTAENVACMVVAVVSGAGIVTAINLITSVPAFWIVVATPVTLTVNHVTQFARYPLSIYRKPVRMLLTWLLPYGLASFYPAQYLLRRDMGWMAFAGVPVATVLLVVAYAFWQYGLRHYQGTGS